LQFFYLHGLMTDTVIITICVKIEKVQ